MKVMGIIAEYNPFHNGHLYHLTESKKMIGADFVVAVMSGNFTQRGEPAIYDKWTRSKISVDCGVDLVLELPFIYACSSAEFFAAGGVRLLEGLGCVDYLSFGSESGDIKKLKPLAGYLADEPREYRDKLRDNLQQGFSFPKARALTIEEILGSEVSDILRGSNNILAIEYLKQLHRTKSKIAPVTLPRLGSRYNEPGLDGNFPSAGAVREAIRKGEDISKAVPIDMARVSEKQRGVFCEDLYTSVIQSVMCRTEKELSETAFVNEGLENKLKAEMRMASSLESYVNLLSAKRYPKTKIQRMLIHVLFGLKKEAFDSMFKNGDIYGRVLAFNSKGAELLKKIKKSEDSTLEIVTNINKDISKDSEIRRIADYDILASDIYNLTAGRDLYSFSDHLAKPYVAK